MNSNLKPKAISLTKWQEEDGAVAVEYGLLVGLIAIFLITAVSLLGTNLQNTFNKAACKVSGKNWNDTTLVCS